MTREKMAWLVAETAAAIYADVKPDEQEHRTAIAVDEAREIVRLAFDIDWKSKAGGDLSIGGKTWLDVRELMVSLALEATDGNRKQAAIDLCIGERTLYRWIEETEGPS